jgi:predicted transcriptional regulator
VSKRRGSIEVETKVPQNMDRLDVEILQRLSQDARTSYLEIARELKVENATVHEAVGESFALMVDVQYAFPDATSGL